jgi:hypothetical protein
MAECQQFEKRVRPSKETAVEREAARKTFVCSVHSVILYRMLYGMELGMYSSQIRTVKSTLVLNAKSGSCRFQNRRTYYYYRDPLILRTFSLG